MNKLTILALALTALAACSHEKEAPPAPKAGAPEATATLPAALKLEAAPPAAISVIELRNSAVDGAEVVVTGRVKDFGSNRAVFTIADLSLRACSDEGDPMADSCETPWDYCCIDSKVVAQGTTAIELRDGAEPAKGTAQGWNGLDHLKQVTVRGKVKRAADGDLAVIADGIFIGS
jgi:hypothetical protein